MVQRFVAKEYTFERRRSILQSADGWNRDIWSKLAEMGLLSLPVPVWIYAIAFVIGAYVWYQTPYGRHMAAIGGARDAAKALGIKVKAIPFWLYVASGFSSAIGGLIVTSELDGASVDLRRSAVASRPARSSSPRAIAR